MKVLTLIALVLSALTLSSAEDNPRGKVIQVCGAELAKAMKRVCVDGDLDYFNQLQIQHNHHHDHNHQHGRDHQHNHQHDHQHNHQLDHEHDHHHDWKHLEKELPTNLADECCLKPCHVTDFVTYCPDKIE